MMDRRKLAEPVVVQQVCSAVERGWDETGRDEASKSLGGKRKE